MEQKAGYIKQVDITGLWGRQNINWELRPDVNILSGINGCGKSSILKAIFQTVYNLKEQEKMVWLEKIHISFYNEADICGKIDLINNFDRPLFESEAIQKLTDKYVMTELDLQLYQLQKSYLEYQINTANRVIRLLSSKDETMRMKADSITEKKIQFFDMLDGLYHSTGKRIDRSKNDVQFLLENKVLLPYQLSAGEKQILAILLTVLIQDEEPSVLLMDEPEISLHIEWQKDLINNIRKLNPNVQIILATHSPAVIMNGWLDAVTEVGDISSTYKK